MRFWNWQGHCAFFCSGGTQSCHCIEDMQARGCRGNWSRNYRRYESRRMMQCEQYNITSACQVTSIDTCSLHLCACGGDVALSGYAALIHCAGALCTQTGSLQLRTQRTKRSSADMHTVASPLCLLPQLPLPFQPFAQRTSGHV